MSGDDCPSRTLRHNWPQHDSGEQKNAVLMGETVLSLMTNYPDCDVQHPSFIGNGLCDMVLYGSFYNTESCGFDGGDCIPDGGFSDCVGPGVNPSFIGNV